MMRKPTTNDKTEHHIKKEVRLILKDAGWNFWMPSANAFGRSGVSDFLAVKRPQLFVAIETKYDDVPTQLQLAFLKMVHDAGHYAFVVDETNVDVLRKLLTNKTGIRSVLMSEDEAEYKSLMKWLKNLTPQPVC